jgi:hydrogenase-4 component E
VIQIVGYLVFENSAFILAISIAAFQPLLVEMGVLLDMLVAVFIMVMAVNHIHTKHKTIDVESLERLTR